MLKKHARTCGPVPAMQTAERRVAETTVDAALQRLSASGVEVSRAAARSLLIAEQKLDELGVRCDLVARLITLEQTYASLGLGERGRSRQGRPARALSQAAASESEDPERGSPGGPPGVLFAPPGRWAAQGSQ